MSTMNLVKMTKALGRLREIQTDFPASALHCLLVVIMEEGLNQKDIAQRANIPKSSNSRCLRLLSSHLAPDKEGMGLIELRQDQADIRFKSAYLTPKGLELKAELLKILE